ncbi:PREDICTED: outer dense fiber protein 3 [Nipponia nippon]|uniref:outer dense fiber protein 3 n=1 Tax=Nipponia nippon TaxID=128390 RepID=UPI000510CEFF|nr:PREDICTED: outer dense fiber protein 3 [Nipponia nippon]
MAKAERGFVATSSVEGAWVGTWRPHRPHGPIMAQFTSPGPKYSIPGTTGYLADNPTKAKAPAYTFQRAKPPAAESCSPGPRYYVQPRVTSNGKDVAPAQHMGGLPKLKTAVTPGPTSSTSAAAATAAKSRHLPLAPSSLLPLSQTPGPTAFPRVELDIYKKRAPAYTMGTKTGLGGDQTPKPGPADYCLGKVTLIRPRAPAPTVGL